MLHNASQRACIVQQFFCASSPLFRVAHVEKPINKYATRPQGARYQVKFSLLKILFISKWKGTLTVMKTIEIKIVRAFFGLIQANIITVFGNSDKYGIYFKLTAV